MCDMDSLMLSLQNGGAKNAKASELVIS